MTNIPAADRTTTTVDNRPPLITTDELASENQALNDRLAEFKLTSAKCPAVINDDEASGVWQDFVKVIDGTTKNLEAKRIDAKEPYLVAGRIVDGYYQTLKTEFARVRSTVADTIEDYLTRKRDAERKRLQEAARKLREEEDRKRQEAAAAEEAARRAEERNRPKEADTRQHRADVANREANEIASTAIATEKAATVKSADLSRTRSASGSLGTLGDKWDFRITDYEAIKGSQLWQYIGSDAKEKAIRSYMRTNAPKTVDPNAVWQPLSGVEFFRTSKLQVR